MVKNLKAQIWGFENMAEQWDLSETEKKLLPVNKYIFTCFRNLDLRADSLLDCFLFCLLSSRSSCRNQELKLSTKELIESLIVKI